jgi:hypothetical protein
VKGWCLPAALAVLAWMAAPAERPVPFRAGETLTFDVSWSQFVTAGTATMAVREKRPSFDSVAYYIVADGQPTALLSRLYTLYYKADTLLDVSTLLPQRASVYSKEGARERMKALRFDQIARRGVYEIKTSKVVTRTLTLPAMSQDPLSAIYVLRSSPLKLGATITMPVVNNGDIYRMDAKVIAKETVTTSAGQVSSWKIVPTIFDEHGKPTGGKLGLWISDDGRKLPVKLEANLPIGDFRITLREVRN